jgi:hypothetical protein
MKCLRMRLVLLIVVGLSGCQRAPPTTPDGTFRVFTEALKKQDAKTAFSMLTQKSRSALEARSKALADASKGTVKDEPALLAFRTPNQASPVISITVSQSDDAKAVLEVKTCRLPLDASGACPAGADVQERVTMMKEAQRWAVELPELVTP